MTTVKQAKRRRAAFKVLLLLFVLAAAALLGYQVLRVEEFEIVGNSQVSYSEIVRLCGVPQGEHWFSIDEAKVKQDVESNPYLQVTSVDFALPSTLRITVQERQACAAIQYMERSIFIDDNGVVLDIRSGADLTGMVVIRGVAVSTMTLGETLGVQDEYQLSAMTVLLKNLLSSNQIVNIREIDMTSTMDIVLVTHEGMILRIGQAHELTEKFELAQGVIADLANQGIADGIINVTNIKSASYAPFPQEEGEEDIPAEEEQDGAPDEEPEGEPGDPAENGGTPGL